MSGHKQHHSAYFTQFTVTELFYFYLPETQQHASDIDINIL